MEQSFQTLEKMWLLAAHEQELPSGGSTGLSCGDRGIYVRLANEGRGKSQDISPPFMVLYSLEKVGNGLLEHQLNQMTSEYVVCSVDCAES
jgi:hypothetical protein